MGIRSIPKRFHNKIQFTLQPLRRRDEKTKAIWCSSRSVTFAKKNESWRLPKSTPNAIHGNQTAPSKKATSSKALPVEIPMWNMLWRRRTWQKAGSVLHRLQAAADGPRGEGNNYEDITSVQTSRWLKFADICNNFQLCNNISAKFRLHLSQIVKFLWETGHLHITLIKITKFMRESIPKKSVFCDIFQICCVLWNSTNIALNSVHIVQKIWTNHKNQKRLR